MLGISSKRFFYINSQNRLSGTESAFSYQLQIPAEENFDRCVVMGCSIPISYYLVDHQYNTFQLQELGVNTTITIPIGNYNINSFSRIVSSGLTTSSPNGWTYTMSYPNSYTQNSTGKFSFAVTGNNNNQPSFIFDSKNFLNEQFGFNNGSTVTFNANALISTNVVNFINETSLFIHSDVCDSGDTDILQAIYANNNTNLSTINYQCSDALAYSKRLKVPKNGVANFYLTDSNGIVLNLNGQSLLITLLMYRDTDIFKIVKKFIQYIITKENTSESHEALDV